MGENQEENPAVFLPYNGDDDDGNGKVDALHQPVANENDLVPVYITVQPYDIVAEYPQATVSVRLVQEGARGALWADPEKTIAADRTLTVATQILGQPNQAALLYVERTRDTGSNARSGDKGLKIEGQLGNVNKMAGQRPRDSARFASSN